MFNSLVRIFVSLMMISLCLSARLAQADIDNSTTPSEIDINKKSLIDGVLDKSGLKTLIDGIPDRAVQAFRLNGQRTKSAIPIEQIEKLARDTFSSQGIEQSVVSAIMSNYDEKRLRAYLAITATPLWMHMTELRLAKQNPDDFRSFVGNLNSNPLSLARTEILKHLDEGGHLSKTGIEMGIAMARSYALVVAEVNPENADNINHQIDLERERLLEVIPKAILLGLAFTYRDVSDADLKEYIKLLGSEDVQWFYEIVFSSIKDKMRDDSKNFGEQMLALIEQSIPGYEQCESRISSDDERITGCTSAIDSGKFSSQDLSIAYTNRGNGWGDKGDYDRAIADYSEAIRLNPQDANAYTNRGNAWSYKSDDDRAIADYNEAIRLNPQIANAFNGRANAWGDKGDYDRAIADFNEAIRLNPQFAVAIYSRGRMQFYKARFDLAADDLATANHLATTDAYVTDNDAYVVIWLYLARMRIGTSAQDDFAQQAKALPADKWPMPVINFYLGNLKAAELTAAAANADPKTQSNQQCEASFYLGEWFLLHKDVEQAKKLLLNAQASCPKDFFEYQGSVAELKRLQ